MPLTFSSRFKQTWPRIFFALAVIYLTLFLLRPLDLTTVDLGRHIANGRELLAGHTQVLFSNHYSYTMPRQRFVNHHWLFGVLVFLLEQTVGFVGIHLANITLMLLILGLLYRLLKQQGSPTVALLLLPIATAFFSTRTEIRPENIGLLFVVMVLGQIYQVIRSDQLNTQQLLLLWLIQLVWVNTHVSFIFSFFLIGLLWSCSKLLRNPHLNSKTQRSLFVLLLGAIIISLINPNTWRGLLEPFTILIDYGYSIVENQTLLFLFRVIKDPILIIYGIYLLIFSIFFVISWRKIDWFEIGLAITGLVLGYLALRHLLIMIVFTLPVLAKMVTQTTADYQQANQIQLAPKAKLIFLLQVYLWTGVFLLTGVMGRAVNFSNRRLGLEPNQLQAVEFIKQNNLPQPIFNNYDLGSYLIYHLYPDFTVFTDNRPEAYSKSFFQDVYIPMQQDKEVWQQAAKENQFNTVIFGIQDITPWGRQFVVMIDQDPEWERVYTDEVVAIWTKN